MDTTKMRTWAEIDLSALEHNYRALRAIRHQAYSRFLAVREWQLAGRYTEKFIHRLI